jgi:hypothetical protein
MWSVVVLAQYAGTTTTQDLNQTPAIGVIPGFASATLANAAATALAGLTSGHHWTVIAKAVQVQ